MDEEQRRKMASPAIPKFPEGQPTASVRDWSQTPMVAAAMKTGNIADIEKATKAARDAFYAGSMDGIGNITTRQVALNPTQASQQRTPEQQQALLTQMRERGAALNQQRTDFVQNTIEQRRANPATAYTAQTSGLTGSSSFRVGVPTNMFGQPIQSFQNIYAQRQPSTPSIGSQTAVAQAQPSSMGGGFMASGFMPSFTSTGNQTQERSEWLRRNFPQDYFTTPFGGEGKRMIARSTPWDQRISL